MTDSVPTALHRGDVFETLPGRAQPGDLNKMLSDMDANAGSWVVLDIAVKSNAAQSVAKRKGWDTEKYEAVTRTVNDELVLFGRRRP